MFVPHGVVIEEARGAAEELNLPPWWLNERASVCVSGKDDPGKRRVCEHPNLRIMVASPEHIFAMKALAARIRDIDDLQDALVPMACSLPWRSAKYSTPFHIAGVDSTQPPTFMPHSFVGAALVSPTS